eukprot:CAMPEP_0194125054 /NCGR_PEP_ID=MMETSP0150-20130528/59261_1 /TAXON_ID=122233 /ORGANISM="Chaetoceros debilis, Strain MM31A-1" /LENGTH=580 /DNA_ID=CAMNT_0038818845 /DNA_START=107 /DNA_END=1849 /DNA_ORIENTATION=+
MKSKASEVSRCLHRLSGVYQDPSRVSRDATTLLQSETGKHLLVQSSTFLQNDGSETASLLVTGTIAMFYRGVTYNTPIDMYLPPHYPNRPPITFVRPVSSMMIKEGHNHVGSDGMVYMPYLSSWQKQSHNLVDACLNMSSIFSNEPPCYAKPPGYNANANANAASSRPAAATSMFYRGVTYNTPIDMYLPPHYPNRPPITFVRPVSSMMIKEGHNHVGSDGMVYMPYLSSWQKQSHNLVDACLNMSSIFSNEPPCYAKPPGYNANANANAASSRPAAATSTAANANFNGSTASASSSTRPTPTPPRYQDIASSIFAKVPIPGRKKTARPTPTPTPPRYQDIASSIFAKVPIPGRKKTATNNNTTNTNTNNVQVPSEQEQIDQLAREAEAANDAVKIARAADAKEEQEQRLLTNDRQRLTSRCNAILTSYKETSTAELTDLIGDEMLLHKSSALLKDRIAYLHNRRGELETYHSQIDASIVEMQNYIQGSEEEKNGRGEVSADEMALPADIQSGQMLILSAENAAINDALFFLDKGLAENNGDNGYGLEVHMAAVRKLAKKQFLVRAHLLKIGQGKAYSSR